MPSQLRDPAIFGVQLRPSEHEISTGEIGVRWSILRSSNSERRMSGEGSLRAIRPFRRHPLFGRIGQKADYPAGSPFWIDWMVQRWVPSWRDLGPFWFWDFWLSNRDAQQHPMKNCNSLSRREEATAGEISRDVHSIPSAVADHSRAPAAAEALQGEKLHHARRQYFTT